MCLKDVSTVGCFTFQSWARLTSHEGRFKLASEILQLKEPIVSTQLSKNVCWMRFAHTCVFALQTATQKHRYPASVFLTACNLQFPQGVRLPGFLYGVI